MDFGQKLRLLRKQKGMTQEELAASLFVSRTAISKWESGRGLPSIDSLRAISDFFSVSLDDLLSASDAASAAAEDKRSTRSLVFGVLDLSFILLFFLPLFGVRSEGGSQAVSLLALDVLPLIRIALTASAASVAVFGILLLALQGVKASAWIALKDRLSLGLTALALLLFTVCLQPYAAVFSFVSLAVKTLLLIKRA